MVALLEEAAAANVESLIIDLRGNGGGSLAEAISLTGLFIDQGPVVQVADGSGRKEVNGDRDGKTFYNGPLVVMVDRYSASASEIFAAALQDYNRAVIVGENTYGKGTVQQHRGIARPFDFYDEPLGSVQYTMAKFYRINGGSTQLRGVQPDLEYPSIIDAEEFGESSQENALPWDQITPAKYQTTNSIHGYDFKTLQQQLDEQIQGNPEFNYIFADIERYQQEKEKTWVSLVLAERKAEEAADKARNLARANERLQRLGQEPVEKIDEIPTDLEAPDPYLEETVELAFRLVDQAKMAAN